MNVLFLSMTFPDVVSPGRGTYNLEFCAAHACRTPFVANDDNCTHRYSELLEQLVERRGAA